MNPLNQQVSEVILNQRVALATGLVEREFADRHGIAQGNSRMVREKSMQDADYLLSHLAQAIALESQKLFTDYAAWFNVTLSKRGAPSADLVFHLKCLTDALSEGLPAESSAIPTAFVQAALDAIPSMPDDLPSFLSDDEPLAPIAHQYFEALRRGDRHVASRLILDSIAAGASIKDVYLQVFVPTQHEIGRLWQTNQMTVAQEHYCTAATQLIMSQLYSYIFDSEKNGKSLVATCVAGDLHELGIRMVADFFEMEGWSTYYLGANTPHSSVVSALMEQGADVLAISATLSCHVNAVRDLIDVVRGDAACAGIKILVGGYPFNQSSDLWRQVGADGSAPDAQQAIVLANQLTAEARV